MSEITTIVLVVFAFVVWVVITILYIRSRTHSPDELVLVRTVDDGNNVDSYQDETIRYDHVAKYLQAQIRLRHKPGINPHNNEKTHPIKAVLLLYQTQKGTVYTSNGYRGWGPYWWTTPDLMNNDDLNGALIYRHELQGVIWGKPKVIWKKRSLF